jgi:hypothetical protein
MAKPETQSVLTLSPPLRPRKLKDVPFVELFGKRVQGVVSSGSDVNRVYVSFYEAQGGGQVAYSCSTNNNRPCGGGGVCKHLQQLMGEAVLQYGAERVARSLELQGDLQGLSTTSDVMSRCRWGGRGGREDAGVVFSRFLSYLRYIEREQTTQAIPEMAWFITG